MKGRELEAVPPSLWAMEGSLVLLWMHYKVIAGFQEKKKTLSLKKSFFIALWKLNDRQRSMMIDSVI